MTHTASPFHQVYSHFWHPIALSSQVGDKPLAARLLDTDLVIWRADGRLNVTSRYCAHRGTDLVAGRIEPEGLRCCFHGWRYGADGRCNQVPQLAADKPIPEKARIRSYPVQERYGMVFTCLSGEPHVPLPEWPELEADRAIAPLPVRDWKTSAGRAIETFLDLGHLSWVHEGTFGNPGDHEIRPYSIQPVPNGLKYRYSYPSLTPPIPGVPQKVDTVTGNYEVYFPYMGRLHFQPVHFFENYLYFFASPLSVDQVRCFAFVNFAKPLGRILENFVKMDSAVQDQDQVALELQVDRVHRIEEDAEVHSEADQIHVDYRAGLRALHASVLRGFPRIVRAEGA